MRGLRRVLGTDFSTIVRREFAAARLPTDRHWAERIPRSAQPPLGRRQLAPRARPGRSRAGDDDHAV